MHAIALSWEQSAALAVVAVGAGAAMSLSRRPRVRAFGAFARESAMIAALFALWQLAGELSLMGTQGAMARSQWLHDVETRLLFPPEQDVQALILGHPAVVQFANLYYATMHFAMLFVFLIWLFVRHRDVYRPIRSVVAVATLLALLIQFIPFAPPRMFPGFVDTAVLYGQSVYGGAIGDQFSAMPSVHVEWAVIIGFYTWKVGTGRWRYLGAAHAVATVFVVVATANHWWLDGIVAVLLVVVSAWIVAGLQALAGRLRPARLPQATAEPAAEPVCDASTIA